MSCLIFIPKKKENYSHNKSPSNISPSHRVMMMVIAVYMMVAHLHKGSGSWDFDSIVFLCKICLLLCLRTLPYIQS